MCRRCGCRRQPSCSPRPERGRLQALRAVSMKSTRPPTRPAMTAGVASWRARADPVATAEATESPAPASMRHTGGRARARGCMPGPEAEPRRPRPSPRGPPQAAQSARRRAGGGFRKSPRQSQAGRRPESQREDHGCSRPAADRMTAADAGEYRRRSGARESRKRRADDEDRDRNGAASRAGRERQGRQERRPGPLPRQPRCRPARRDPQNQDAGLEACREKLRMRPQGRRGAQHVEDGGKAATEQQRPAEQDPGACGQPRRTQSVANVAPQKHKDQLFVPSHLATSAPSRKLPPLLALSLTCISCADGSCQATRILGLCRAARGGAGPSGKRACLTWRPRSPKSGHGKADGRSICSPA